MSNTVIQIKRSSSNTIPASLNVGELAYSFVSDKLFIGNNTNNVITIGGKYYVDLLDNASAPLAGNTIVRRDDAGNAAFTMVTVTDDPSNGIDVVNKSYLDSRIGALSSNTIYDGTSGQNGYSNVFVKSTVGGGSVGIVANNVTVATFSKTTASFAQDVAVTGNLLVKGTTSYTNVQSLLVSNNDIILNANAAGYPLINAYITVNRGAADNALGSRPRDLSADALQGRGARLPLLPRSRSAAARARSGLCRQAACRPAGITRCQEGALHVAAWTKPGRCCTAFG
mgnify:CR=1 FL=1